MNPFRWGLLFLTGGILTTLALGAFLGVGNRIMGLGLIIAVIGLALSGLYFIEGEDVDWRFRRPGGGRSH